MNTRLLLSCIAVLFSSFAFAQTDDTDLYRTIDGRYNNPNFDHWGASHTALRRFTGNGYVDGQSEPVADRPNPRVISNTLFAQEGLLNDPVGLSDFTWVFGQFMDHDIALTEEVGEPFNIPVPMGDPAFDPLNFGTVVIPLTRNAPRFGTGSGTNNPRQYNNDITAFIDGSGVYGSDEHRAEWLRSHVDGKMKVSRGNMLPYNTITGEIEGPEDPNAPHMANATGFRGRMYVAGDVRANENPLLASFHTLFVREHNRQCDLLKAANPDWTDDQLYHHARKIVGGLIQSITYDEWLPAMGVPILDYEGFNPSVNPQLTNVFSAAAFRVGHTLLNSNLRRLDASGQVIEDGNLTLREAFFNPPVLQDYGIDVYLRGMAEQVQQKMDNRVVDDVRNFLFGPPGAGGLDLASINIARGRDRGLSSYNAIRQDYGLPLLFEFADINPDEDVHEALSGLYGSDINKIDPWVAMLSERPVSGSIFGPTIQRIMQKQFSDLRDGDRFFYQNDPMLSEEEKNWIQATTFRDIIMYNSSISLMQENVFEAMPFSEVCGSSTVAVDGLVRVHTTDAPLQDVTINVLTDDGELTQTELTSDLGFYDFDALPACDNTILTAQRDDDWAAGVDIFDMVAIQRQLLGIEELANPYQFLAADANGDATIDVFD
ncbi:peroxidase family protein, partial [Neolewinella agarilytica]|uniref:peroxidase family protein n=1 Tax=Neolewinella agarilytica TaxID=478744 RepID=UPI002355F712